MTENEKAVPSEQELLRTINATPLLQSVLYDLNLLPEQLQEGSREMLIALAFGYVWQAASSATPTATASQESMPGLTDREKIASDMRLYGTAFAVGGKHVPPDQVVMFTKNTAHQDEPVPDGWCKIYADETIEYRQSLSSFDPDDEDLHGGIVESFALWSTPPTSTAIAAMVIKQAAEALRELARVNVALTPREALAKARDVVLSVSPAAAEAELEALMMRVAELRDQESAKGYMDAAYQVSDAAIVRRVLDDKGE